MAARDKPPSCLRQGRVRGRTGQAALLPAARAGAWPHGTSRPLACGKGGCVAARDKPPSCLRQGRVRGRTGQAAFLPAARAGAWPHGTSRPLAYGKGGCVAARDKPPSCLRQGRVRGRTGQAALLPAARAGSSYASLRRVGSFRFAGKAKNRASALSTHCRERSVSERCWCPVGTVQHRSPLPLRSVLNVCHWQTAPEPAGETNATCLGRSPRDSSCAATRPGH